MPRWTLRIGFLAIAFIVGVWVFHASSAFAMNACQCGCFDSEETTSLLRVPSQSATTVAEKEASCSATEATAVCPVACKGVQKTFVEGEYNPNSNRCVCQCSTVTQTVKYAKLQPTQNDCKASCASTCGGSANVLPDPTITKVVSVDCITASDCAAGGWVYEGIACSLFPDKDFPGGKPTCTVPVTKKNAQLECEYYGGIAKGKGSACAEIQSGENPNTYYKSRALFGREGKNFPETFTDYKKLNAALDALNGQTQPRDAGICYRYGLKYGGLPEFQDETTGGSGEGFFSSEGSGHFLCVNKKRNTCGFVQPPGNMVPQNLPASAYTCQRPTEYNANNVNVDAYGNKVDASLTGCFGPTNGEQYADVCINDPGKLCCQSRPAGSCRSSKECSLDRSKVCVGPDGKELEGTQILNVTNVLYPTIYGTCRWNTVCDPKHNQPIENADTPWMYDHRVCRVASAAERANNEICSSESAITSMPRRCPNQSHSCCRPVNTEATGNCAMDKLAAYGSGGWASSPYVDFACVDQNTLPTFSGSQQVTLRDGKTVPVTYFVTTPDGSKHLVDDANINENKVGNGAGCLIGDVATKSGTVVVGTAPRCGKGKVCCNAKVLTELNANPPLATRAKLGELCGTHAAPDDPAPFKCQSYKELFGNVTDETAQVYGFASVSDYVFKALGSKACEVTFPDPAFPYNSLQCEGQNNFCCAPLLAEFCADDAGCKVASDILGCREDSSKCLKCDPTLNKCVLDPVIQAGLQSPSCFVRGKAEGATTADAVKNVTNVSEEQFSCQTVFPETLGVYGKCLPQGKGCGTEVNADGSFQACCIPGVGATPAATAKKRANVAIDGRTLAAENRLWLPTYCFTDGNCSLDDIIITGAQFANFLISISGAVFLAIFVYAGFLYLTSATSGRAKQGKEMLIEATTAMVLLMGAFIFVRFVQSSLIGGVKGGNVANQCGAVKDTENMACTLLIADPSDTKGIAKETKDRGCKAGLCSGPSNYVCCPL
jgi:hypothetical protein